MTVVSRQADAQALMYFSKDEARMEGSSDRTFEEGTSLAVNQYSKVVSRKRVEVRMRGPRKLRNLPIECRDSCV